jgi:multidrug resistance efflux pump
MSMRVLTSAFAAVGLSAAVAMAQEPSRMPSEQPSKGAQASFEALDRNKDQQLSKAEAAADTALAARFASIDANADGYISKREYSASAGPMKEPRSPPPEPQGR